MGGGGEQKEKVEEKEIQIASSNKWLIGIVITFQYKYAKSFLLNTNVKEIFQQIYFVLGIPIFTLKNSWYVQKMANSLLRLGTSRVVSCLLLWMVDSGKNNKICIKTITLVFLTLLMWQLQTTSTVVILFLEISKEDLGHALRNQWTHLCFHFHLWGFILLKSQFI